MRNRGERVLFLAVCSLSMDALSHPQKISVTSTFFRWGKQGIERLGNIFKVFQDCKGTKLWLLPVWLPGHDLNYSSLLPFPLAKQPLWVTLAFTDTWVNICNNISLKLILLNWYEPLGDSRPLSFNVHNGHISNIAIQLKQVACHRGVGETPPALSS